MDSKKLKELFKNKKLLITVGIGIVIAIIVIIAVLMLVGNNLGGENKDNSSVYEVKSFFIENKEGMYAIFNKEGKKLTDYIFKSKDDFIGGSTVVKNDKKEEGIISESGKMLVEFGKYEYISKYGPLYKASSFKADKDISLILNCKGEIISDKLGTSVINDGLIIKDEKEYKVVSADGKTIYSFANAGEDVDTPHVEGEEGYVVISYNNTITLIDYKKAKKLVSFNDDGVYTINSINIKNKNQLILSKAYAFYEKQEEYAFKYIDGDKIKFESKDEYTNVVFERGILYAIMKNDKKKVFLDENGNKISEHSSVTDVIYNSAKNMAVEDKEGKETVVKMYSDGNLVNTLKNVSISMSAYSYEDLYPLYSSSIKTDDNKTISGYKYYNSKGEIVINEVFSKARVFEEDGLAIVTDSDKKMYLIDKTGKKLTQGYKGLYSPLSTIEIGYNEKYYIATNDGNCYILNTKCEVIYEGEFTGVSIESKNNREYVMYKTKENKYELYDIKDKKVIIKSDEYISFQDNYIIATNEGKDQYYTYNGKLMEI